MIDNVLSQDECDSAETLFWNEMSVKGNGLIRRDDYRTHEDENWPSQSKFLSEKGENCQFWELCLDCLLPLQHVRRSRSMSGRTSEFTTCFAKFSTGKRICFATLTILESCEELCLNTRRNLHG